MVHQLQAMAHLQLPVMVPHLLKGMVHQRHPTGQSLYFFIRMYLLTLLYFFYDPTVFQVQVITHHHPVHPMEVHQHHPTHILGHSVVVVVIQVILVLFQVPLSLDQRLHSTSLQLQSTMHLP